MGRQDLNAPSIQQMASYYFCYTKSGMKYQLTWLLLFINKIQMCSSGSEFCTKPDCVGNRSSPSDLPQCYDFFLFGIRICWGFKNISDFSKNSILNSHIFKCEYYVYICITSTSNCSSSVFGLHKPTAPCGVEIFGSFLLCSGCYHDRILIWDILSLQGSVR